MTLPLRARIRKQLFIPLTVQEEALLQLYRDLLQAGVTFSRGKRITLALESDKSGTAPQRSAGLAAG